MTNLGDGRSKAQLTRKEDPLQTPTRQVARTTSDFTGTQSIGQQDTVRHRRGFRPLSVLTNSALYPFDRETLQAMRNLDVFAPKPDNPISPSVLKDGNQATPESSASSNIKKERKHQKIPRPPITPAYSEAPSSASKFYHSQIRDSASRSIATLSSTTGSEISLGEFLRTSSPITPALRADFTSLVHLPPPDPSQHPIHQPNPFTCYSASPSLTTSSKEQDIREWAAKSKLNQSPGRETNTTGSSETGSTEKRRNFSLDIFKTPERLRRRMSKSPNESPLQKRYCSIEIPRLSTESSITEEDRKKSSSSGRLRKISSMFKTKSDVDAVADTKRKSSGASEALTPSPTLTDNTELEEFLRRISYSPSYPFHPASWYPRHPSTSRSWKSRNLKCTNCSEAGCACCGRACCAYKAAVLALETHKNNPEGRATAMERIQQINVIFPYGKEAPTFLQCTKDPSGQAGCGKMVCPDCCGVCPNETCADTQCKRCKRDPWGECEWHKDDGLVMNSVSHGK